jgi:hypothetical protein
MRVIAFAGKAGVGKTAAAMHLVEEYGASKLSFATPLRQELVEANFPWESVYAKPTPPAYRRLLQYWSDCRLAYNKDYFADDMAATLLAANDAEKHSLYDDETILAIDDLRYDNEVSMLAKLHGMTGIQLSLVHLERLGLTVDAAADAHRSEHGITTFGESLGWETWNLGEGDFDALHKHIAELM